MNRKKLIIMGAGGWARKVYECVDKESYIVLGFYDENPSQISLMDLPVCDNFSHFGNHPYCEYVLGVGDIALRKKFALTAHEANLRPCKPIIHETAVIVPDRVKIMDGTVIAPFSVIASNVTLQNHTIISEFASLGHDVVVGSYSFIGPGARVGGETVIESECWIGTGAIIREKLAVRSRSTVGLGSAVVKEVCAGTVVMGNPAKERR
jgi:sugar O-acyltransferase (sialic acid O-acetyltransferase NeuD family)